MIRMSLLRSIAVVVIGLMWGLNLGSAIAAPLAQGFPQPTAEGVVELKTYTPYRAATVTIADDGTYAPTRGFLPLFLHIRRNHIAMTAPVEARYPIATLQQTSAKEATVSFVYPCPDIVPKHVASGVEIEDRPGLTVVSVGILGGYDYDLYLAGLKQLQAWLATHREYEVVGLPRRLFYNSPAVANPQKRSDIQIPVALVAN